MNVHIYCCNYTVLANEVVAISRGFCSLCFLQRPQAIASPVVNNDPRISADCSHIHCSSDNTVANTTTLKGCLHIKSSPPKSLLWDISSHEFPGFCEVSPQPRENPQPSFSPILQYFSLAYEAHKHIMIGLFWLITYRL